MNLLRRLNGLFLRVRQEPIRTKCCNLNLILVDDAQATCETKTIKKRRPSRQQNCKRIACEYDQRKFAFLCAGIDFTTIEAATEVLLIKYRKAASYN